MTISRKLKKTIRKQPPIVIVPDKTYIDDTGNVIPTDVILISDLTVYNRMEAVLEAWRKCDKSLDQKGKIKK